MVKALALSTIFCVASAASAWAACPPTNPAAFPDAVKETGQRIVCIQNELAEATRQRSYEFQLNSVDRLLQDLQLQRRFDALPPPLPPILVPPSVYPTP